MTRIRLLFFSVALASALAWPALAHARPDIGGPEPERTTGSPAAAYRRNGNALPYGYYDDYYGGPDYGHPYGEYADGWYRPYPLAALPAPEAAVGKVESVDPEHNTVTVRIPDWGPLRRR